MTTDGEREVMALMLTTNAQMAATVLRGEGASEGRTTMGAIAATRTLALLVDDTLRALVHQARNEGTTWAEIGEILHVTRQAAFQRFGSLSTTGTNEEETMIAIPEAGSKAKSIIELVLGRKWDELFATFDRRCREAASIEIFESVLSNGAKTHGAFSDWGLPVVSVLEDYTVVNVPMAFEKGDVIARVVFNADEQVAGLFFLPADGPAGTTPSGEAAS
jgi:hypothetical protein